MQQLPDIVSRGAPKQLWERARTFPREDTSEQFGRYELRRRIPSGEDEPCYLACAGGIAGFEKLVFLRRFAAARLDPRTIEALKQQAKINLRGISQVFELAIHEQWGYVVGEYVDGASVVELDRGRLSWPVALAIAFDACNHLARIREYDVDGAITPARVRLSLSGNVTLCMGVPKPQPPSWHRSVCDVLYPILSLAATPEERKLLEELFTDENPDSVWVATDALLQRHPELDPVLPIVFLALAGRIDRDVAHATLIQHVPIEQLRALWDRVIDVVRGPG